MGVLEKFHAKKRELEALQAEVEKLENSKELKQERAFQAELEKLMDEYSRSAKQVAALLHDIDPSLKGVVHKQGSRKSRPLKTYTNPHTKEVVKTRGGNHKTLKAWREKYGADKVDSWKEPA